MCVRRGCSCLLVDENRAQQLINILCLDRPTLNPLPPAPCPFLRGVIQLFFFRGGECMAALFWVICPGFSVFFFLFVMSLPRPTDGRGWFSVGRNEKHNRKRNGKRPWNWRWKPGTTTTTTPGRRWNKRAATLCYATLRHATLNQWTIPRQQLLL